MVVLKESFLGWRSNYEDRSKSSWNNSGGLPPVYELLKRPS